MSLQNPLILARKILDNLLNLEMLPDRTVHSILADWVLTLGVTDHHCNSLSKYPLAILVDLGGFADLY
jgi:hypothetical protein